MATRIKRVMERAGTTQTGRALSYIREAFDEMTAISPKRISSVNKNLAKDTRYYYMDDVGFSDGGGSIVSIQIKGHDNDKDEYRKIPRAQFPPLKEDQDGS